MVTWRGVRRASSPITSTAIPTVRTGVCPSRGCGTATCWSARPRAGGSGTGWRRRTGALGGRRARRRISTASISSDPMGDTVLYEREGHVATITYNRPEVLNAINGALRQDLNAAWERFRDDEDAWVAIVTGAGRAFCVGADLRDGAASAGSWPGSFWEIPTINSFESGLEVWKPTIAAVNGYCLGYGLTLVSACDFVIAADDAEFGMPEVRLGVPTVVGAIRLPQRIGMQDALELLLTGDRIDATRAVEIGLAGRVVARAELLDAARALADRLCAGAPLAVRAVKEVAYRGQRLPWVDAVRMGETMRRVVAATDDAAEGRAATVERRDPRWTGH